MTCISASLEESLRLSAAGHAAALACSTHETRADEAPGPHGSSEQTVIPAEAELD